MSTSAKFDEFIVSGQKDILVAAYDTITSAISDLNACYMQENPGFFLNKSGSSLVYDVQSGSYTNNYSGGSDLAVVGGALAKVTGQLDSIYNEMITLIDAALANYGDFTQKYASKLSVVMEEINRIKADRGGNTNE